MLGVVGVPEALTLNVNVNSGGGVGTSGMLQAGIAGGIAGAGVGGILSIGRQLGRELIDASPLLQGTMKLLDSAINQILRPIGDMMSVLIRPMAIKLLEMSVKWLEWMQTVDGKLLMQTIMGLGEILQGLAMITAGTVASPVLSMLGIDATGLIGQGLESLQGGTTRIVTAFQIAAEGGQAAAMALDQLASMDTESLASNFNAVSLAAGTLAQNLLDAAQKILDMPTRLALDKPPAPDLNNYINRSVNTGTNRIVLNSSNTTIRILDEDTGLGVSTSTITNTGEVIPG